MKNYFKELLRCLQSIEKHLSLLSECVSWEKHPRELKVDTSVPKRRKY